MAGIDVPVMVRPLGNTTLIRPMKKRINILECIRQGQVGGGESHLLSLVENLDKEIFNPIVLSFTDGPMIDRLRKMNITVHIIPTLRPFDLTKWKQVQKLLKDHKIELVHAHGTRANSNVLWAARSLGIPVIYTVHGWSFHPDQKPLVRNIRIMGEKYLTSRSDLNISVSASNQQSGKQFINSFKSIVINNGIDLKKFDPSALHRDIRKELNIPADKILVLFIARFTSHKQPLALIEAFSKAFQSNPDLHLLLVGDGDQKEDANDMIRRSGMSEHITMESFRQDVPDVLASADIFVLPSLWEGLPIGLLEALAMGKAVIATNVDGTSEIIENGVNGILIETEDLVNDLGKAIEALSKDKASREKFSHNAMHTITEKYNAANMTKEIENIYLNILKKDLKAEPV
jgi:glycosyltransferase involved in cell wall biosynthesis